MGKMGGRVVIVTGGGGAGCGRTISCRFAAGSAGVVVADADEGGGDTVRRIEAVGTPALSVRTDVRDPDAVERLVHEADAAFGGVDVLVNNASAPHGDASLDSWMDAIETDLLGALNATRAAIPSMRRRGGGAIVNIASISALWHGRTTPGGIPGYDVAKAGMIRMTTRLEPLARTDRIRVNCLAPGWIGTDTVRGYWESLTPAERLERGVPSRLLTPAQVADIVFSIATDPALAGRVLVWWSEDDRPKLIEWGDRGYRTASTYH